MVRRFLCRGNDPFSPILSQQTLVFKKGGYNYASIQLEGTTGGPSLQRSARLLQAEATKLLEKYPELDRTRKAISGEVQGQINVPGRGRGPFEAYALWRSTGDLRKEATSSPRGKLDRAISEERSGTGTEGPGNQGESVLERSTAPQIERQFKTGRELL